MSIRFGRVSTAWTQPAWRCWTHMWGWGDKVLREGGSSSSGGLRCAATPVLRAGHACGYPWEDVSCLDTARVAVLDAQVRAGKQGPCGRWGCGGGAWRVKRWHLLYAVGAVGARQVTRGSHPSCVQLSGVDTCMGAYGCVSGPAPCPQAAALLAAPEAAGDLSAAEPAAGGCWSGCARGGSKQEGSYRNRGRAGVIARN